MEHIWAPWRMEYITLPKPDGCIFCDKAVEDGDKDRENYILYRGKENLVILNSYPYNSGHLMVVPYRHVGSIEELNDEERIEHFELVTRAVGVLKEAFRPQGFNLGMNIGKVSGAGVEGHIHTHIVPRWAGDTNFMPVVAETKVVSEALDATYEKLERLFVI
jgi:ATP adenylyltransferase